MKSLLSNLARTKLVSAINPTATTLSVTAGTGAKMPVTSTTDEFNIILEDASKNVEICRVTNRTGDVLTVVRGQENTVARSFAVGDVVAVRMTAKAFNDKLDQSTAQTLIDATVSAAINALNATLTAAINLKADAAATLAALANKAESAALIAGLALKANLTGASFTGAINEHASTIAASATTTAIWAAGSGNVQTWTGTPVITDFPDAPAPGARRIVYPAVGTTITDNANISVQGGRTYVAEAGDTWNIVAKTVSTFDVEIIRKSGIALTDVTSLDSKVKAFPKSNKASTIYQQFSVLMENNRLKVWGRADNNSLGILNAENAAFPASAPIFNVAVPPGVTVKEHVHSSGGLYVLLTNGWVYSCGFGGYGALGHGDLTARVILTRIEYFVQNNIQIDKIFVAGTRVTVDAMSAYFVNAAGNVWACGYNGNGQLGVGNLINQSTPAPISGAISGVVDIIVSDSFLTHTLLLTNSGVLYAAGYNNGGQLGVGDFGNRNAFTIVTGGTNVKQVAATSGFTSGTGAAGSGTTIVVKNDGTVWTCGFNGYGQLGLNDTTNRNVLTQVSGLTNIKEVGISGGYYGYTYAVSTPGRLYTWGYNAQGVVGNGTLTNQPTPFNVIGINAAPSIDPPFIGKIVQVEPHVSALGSQFLVVLDSDGNLWFTGNDAGFFCGGGVINYPRFAPFLSEALDNADEKIVQIRAWGYDNVYRLFAISDAKKLYGIGENSYSTITGLGFSVSASHIKSLQRVRV